MTAPAAPADAGFGRYVGWLDPDDPLQALLAEVGPRGAVQKDFRVYQLPSAHEVYCYQDVRTGQRVICKFYGSRFPGDPDLAALVARQEYDNLEILRGYGLIGSPHHVVAPLGLAPEVNGALAVEFYSGEGLAQSIRRSTHHHENGHLRQKVGVLADYLATQHSRTANGATIDFDVECDYFDVVLGRLIESEQIESADVAEFAFLKNRWRAAGRMWSDPQVWLHGDATPGNFIFGLGNDVAAIDLERMRRGDRAFDIGRLIGEFQHAYMLTTGRKSRAEPFIGYFFQRYCRHFSDSAAALESISARTPFYMGLTLLRIAHNDYVGVDYRERLIRQSKRLLRLV